MPRFSASLLLAVLVASALTASAVAASNALRPSTNALARAGYVMPRAEEGEPAGGESEGDMAGVKGEGAGSEGEGGAQGGEGERGAEGGEGEDEAEGGEGEGNAGFQLACDVGGVAGGLVTSGISLLSEIQGGELEENGKAQLEALKVILKASYEVGQQVLQACKDAGVIKGGEGGTLVDSSTTPTTPGGTQAATIVNNAVAQANATLAAPPPAVQASNVASSTTAQAGAILGNAAVKSTQASRAGSLLLASVVYRLLTAVVL
ncbi:hypothetical protein FB451DRAFT_1185068 [Mycena latifolia]|nr:hypothetical protein FB451DRAFT_1185068 [Mycena latifolia]